MPAVKGHRSFQPSPEGLAFRSDPTIQKWLSSLHHGTRPEYEHNLRRLCKLLGVTGTQLKEAAERDPKDLSVRVKVVLRQQLESGNNNASKLKTSLVSYLALFDLSLPLVGLKFKNRRAVPHPALTWDEGSRIISLANPAYQPVYKFMQWGLDAQRFMIINNDEAVINDVKQQLEDPKKEFIKVKVVGGRKTQTSDYYVVVPRNIAAYLPVRTVRSEILKSKVNLWHCWRIALKKAGYAADRAHGAHNLRSYWMDEAIRRGLEPVLRQFQLGHAIDPLNYTRVYRDTKWVLEQYQKAWQISPAASSDEVQKLQTKVKEQEEAMQLMSVAIAKLQATAGKQPSRSRDHRKKRKAKV